MMVLYKNFAFAVTLGVLVVFHELGHYVVARLAGVKVLRFSIGFGRMVWSRRFGRDRTEWALSAIPLGGYVKMVDEREGRWRPPISRVHSTASRSARRIAIVAAGPIANLLLAVLLFAGTFVAGIPGQRARAGRAAADPARRRPRMCGPATSWSSPSTASRLAAGRTCAGACSRAGPATTSC